MVRVLVISQRWKYTNPTTNLFVEEFARRPGVTISGRGYPLKSDRIAVLAREHGSFDVILTDPWALTDGPSKHYKGLRPPDILDYGAPVILNLLQNDPHAFSEAFYRDFIGRASFAVSAVASAQFWLPDFTAAATRESWLDPTTYTTANPAVIDDRFLLLPHCVEDSEFQPLGGRRPIDVSVLGSNYHFRRLVREYVGRVCGIRATMGPDLLQKILGRLSDNSYTGKYLLATPLYRHRFARTLRRSLLSVTCDGSVGYPVRKFFEIPACGAVLAARFFREPEALGFRDGENCFFLDEDHLERIDEILRFLKSDSVEAQRIARAGQEMVREFHSVKRRVDQFLEIAEAVAAGTLKTTRWQDGRQVLIERAGS